jgi:hypothetical protein
VLGISPSAGAFLAGSIIAAVKDSKVFEKAVLPHNLMFSSLFFIAIGTLIDFRAIKENILLILFLLVVLIIARFIAVGMSTYLFANMRKAQPIFSSIAMLSVGEFSLLIAKESRMFNVTVDLVSITAILIFLSSIIMSLGVKSSEKMYYALEKERPGRFKRKMDALGNYISGFLEQLDTENTQTNRFKKYASKTVTMIGILFFILIGTHKLSQFMISIGVSSVFVYATILSLIAIAIFIAYLAFVNGRETYKLSVSIISYIDRSMSVKRANKTLKNMAIGMIVVLIGLASPGIIFILQLPLIYVLVPVGIVIIGLYIMSRVFHLLAHFSNDFAGYVPTYKKYNPDLARFQKK